MTKAIYKPKNENTVIIKDLGEYCEVMLGGEFKTVPKSDLEVISSKIKQSSFDELKENIFLNCIKTPLNGILYSYNTNRLTPEPHQYKPLIKFLNSENNRILIADEVGLGKTIEAGMIFKEIDKRDDVDVAIIVVPSSLTPKWRSEMLLRFNEDFEIYKVNEFKRFLEECKNNFESDDSHTITRKIITSYHTLRDEKVVELLETTPLHIDVLIMDEAHTFRNRETSTFDGSARITEIAENILFLTATPVQNSLTDLFNILSLLDEDSYMDSDYFLESIKPNRLLHQIIARLKNHNHLENIKSHIEEYALDTLSLNEYQNDLIQALLNENELTQEERVEYVTQFTEADNLSHIINRTKKKDVGLYIKREATSQTISPSPEEKVFYEQVIEFVKLLFQFKNPKIPAGFITIMPERMASSCMIASIESFKKMRKTKRFFVDDFDDLDVDLDNEEIEEVLLEQLDVLIELGEKIGTVDSKYQAFEKIVNKLKNEDISKMIVFSFFKKTLSYLEDKLTEKGLRVGKIDGDLSPEERFQKIQDFKNDQFDILLSSEVGSEGLDMQFCNVVVNYDMPWNPMRVEQRIGRIDRIGQEAEKLFIFNLCIEGTVEDRIYSRLYNKLDIFESSVGELEPILGDLQKTFDIQKMIAMSDAEIQFKVDLEADALIRKKLEIVEQTAALDGMINDEYQFDSEVDEYTNSVKEEFIRTSVEKLFLGYLQEANIAYTVLNNDTYRVNHDNARQLYDLLKSKIVDKSLKSIYITQKKSLLKVKNSKPYRFTFKQNSDDYGMDQITLSHPMIKMISDNTIETQYGAVKNTSYEDAIYAIAYRQEITTHKKYSTIEVMLLDSNSNYISNTDFSTFFTESSDTNINVSMDILQDIQNKSDLIIIGKIDEIVSEKQEETSRLIDQKILGMQEHYKKRRKYAQKMKSKVTDIDVLRMREAQIINIDKDEINKKKELEAQKKVSGSYQILSVMEILS